MTTKCAFVTALILLAACNPPATTMEPLPETATFGADLEFLQEHTSLVVLTDADGQAQAAVSPDMQGRVLTSTAQGSEGTSFGWINRTVIASGQRQDHINVFGGEDRFWLGPEGGQFSIYFKEGDPFDLDHWHVPEEIDWGPWALVSQSAEQVAFEKDMRLENYSGTVFDLRVDRAVQLLSVDTVSVLLGLEIDPGIRMVAFESVNTVTNTGSEAWTTETGLLSIWILGMYNPSPTTTVVVPYAAGSEEDAGPVVNAAYFGEVPADRLTHDDEVVYFRGDGEFRSKIGFSKARSMPTFGSYDAANGVLTLVQYTLPDEDDQYVNSMWELQEDPFSGDVVNSYNDGPPEAGVPPLGPFFELETSSPAMALAPGEAHTHVHRTIHLQGDEAALDRTAVAVLGKSLDAIQSVFGE